MRTFLMYSLPILILVAMALAIYYLSVRLAWAFGVSRWLMMAIIGTLFVGSFVAMMIVMRGNYTSAVSHIVSNASNIIIGVLMFAVCVTLVVDLVGLFVKMQPRTFGFVALGVTALLSIYSLCNASFTRVYNVDITLPNLVEPLRIAHVSDTHYGHFWGERKAKELAKLIAGEDVDAVVITGDMFDGRVRLSSDVVRPFTELGVPVYFSEG
ncbi:MAG: metallophosphoesterase, partial [Rikenellaceae bacterium]